jgi:hypothetical protein
VKTKHTLYPFTVKIHLGYKPKTEQDESTDLDSRDVPSQKSTWTLSLAKRAEISDVGMSHEPFGMNVWL